MNSGWTTWLPPRRRRVPVVLQATTTDCGAACLAMLLGTAGRPVSLESLREDLGIGRDGVTALDLRDEARRRGLHGKAVRATPNTVGTLPLPLIAHWEDNHFVVVERSTARWVRLVDPSIGRRRLSHAEFAAGFTGIALIFRPPAGPSPGESGTTAGFDSDSVALSAWGSTLWPAITASHRVVLWLLLSTAALLAAGLVIPLATARIVTGLSDPGGGWNGWPVAVVGFTVAIAAISLVRGLLGARLQQLVGSRLPRDLIDQLLAAPLRFFEHRGTGEVVSRLIATDAIRDAFATRLIGAVLDAAIGLAYLAVLSAIDVRLAAVTMALAAGQLAVVGALAVRGRRLHREELLADARCTSWLVESVRGIDWIKSAGAEGMFRRRWSTLHDRRLVALGRAARTNAMAEAVADAFRIGGPLALLVVAATGSVGVTRPLVGSGPGAVVGLAAMAAAALLPLGSLAVNIRSIAEMGSVVDHLTDLASAPAEQPVRGGLPGEISGAVRLHKVGFRYSTRSPWILRDVSVDVPAGGKLAIVGSSGSGKSTLARLICGLYPPTEGAVVLDGRPLQSYDLPSIRRRMGVVLQDPFLLSGTVQDAIALRAPHVRLPQIREAARLAAIHDEILDLPRGYQTWLAEGGAGLSGGQRQRIALARALLDRPSLLVLDEATSHLDATAEATIEQHLRQLGMTRIVVAHRLSTVRDADRVIVLEAGRIVEQGTPDDLLAAGGRFADLAAAQNAQIN